jgi:hypothetical protein
LNLKLNFANRPSQNFAIKRPDTADRIPRNLVRGRRLQFAAHSFAWSGRRSESSHFRFRGVVSQANDACDFEIARFAPPEAGGFHAADETSPNSSGF